MADAELSVDAFLAKYEACGPVILRNGTGWFASIRPPSRHASGVCYANGEGKTPKQAIANCISKIEQPAEPLPEKPF